MSEPVLKVIKFGAEWCGPCQAMERAKTLEKVGKDFKRQGVIIEAVDVDKDEEKAEEFDIQAMPTFVALDADGEEVAREEGAMNYRDLTRFVKDALASLEGDDEDEDEDEDE